MADEAVPSEPTDSSDVLSFKDKDGVTYYLHPKGSGAPASAPPPAGAPPLAPGEMVKFKGSDGATYLIAPKPKSVNLRLPGAPLGPDNYVSPAPPGVTRTPQQQAQQEALGELRKAQEAENAKETALSPYTRWASPFGGFGYFSPEGMRTEPMSVPAAIGKPLTPDNKPIVLRQAPPLGELTTRGPWKSPTEPGPLQDLWSPGEDKDRKGPLEAVTDLVRTPGKMLAEALLPEPGVPNPIGMGAALSGAARGPDLFRPATDLLPGAQPGQRETAKIWTEAMANLPAEFAIAGRMGPEILGLQVAERVLAMVGRAKTAEAVGKGALLAFGAQGAWNIRDAVKVVRDPAATDQEATQALASIPASALMVGLAAIGAGQTLGQAINKKNLKDYLRVDEIAQRSAERDTKAAELSQRAEMGDAAAAEELQKIKEEQVKDWVAISGQTYKSEKAALKGLQKIGLKGGDPTKYEVVQQGPKEWIVRPKEEVEPAIPPVETQPVAGTEPAAAAIPPPAANIQMPPEMAAALAEGEALAGGSKLPPPLPVVEPGPIQRGTTQELIPPPLAPAQAGRLNELAETIGRLRQERSALEARQYRGEDVTAELGKNEVDLKAALAESRGIAPVTEPLPVAPPEETPAPAPPPVEAAAPPAPPPPEPINLETPEIQAAKKAVLDAKQFRDQMIVALNMVDRTGEDPDMAAQRVAQAKATLKTRQSELAKLETGAVLKPSEPKAPLPAGVELRPGMGPVSGEPGFEVFVGGQRIGFAKTEKKGIQMAQKRLTALDEKPPQQPPPEQVAQPVEVPSAEMASIPVAPEQPKAPPLSEIPRPAEAIPATEPRVLPLTTEGLAETAEPAAPRMTPVEFEKQLRDVATKRGMAKPSAITKATMAILNQRAKVWAGEGPGRTVEQFFDRFLGGIRTGKSDEGGFLFQRGAPVADDAINRFRETRLLSRKDVAAILGSERPEHLNQAIDYLREMRDKVRNGELTPREVAKAYLMTVASIRARDAKVTELKLPPNVDIPDAYATLMESGERGVRPEDAMGAWLLTPDGKDALDALDKGDAGKSWWWGAQQTRKAFGIDTLTRMGVFDEKGLASIPEVTKAINEAKGNPDAIAAAVRNLGGIGPAKTGFIKYLLGFGDSPTIDSVELNGWLTGKGSTVGAESKAAEIARWADTQRSNRKFDQFLVDRITNRINEVAAERGVEAGILHHWLWDKFRGSETTHQAMFDAMRYAQEGVGEKGGVAPRGAVEFLDDGRALISIFEKGDPTTIVHELAHVFRRTLPETEFGKIAEAYGTTPEKFGREHEERFVADHEKWLATGEAPTPELKTAFQRFSEWIKEIWRAIGGDPEVKIPDQVRGVLERMYGKVAEEAPAARREPWQMKRAEFVPEFRKEIAGNVAEMRAAFERGVYPMTERTPYGERPLSGEAARAAAEENVLRAEKGKPDWYYEEEAAARHKIAVEEAVKEGKAVPAEVLAEYPDLAPKSETAPAGKKGSFRMGGMNVETTDTVPQKEIAPRNRKRQREEAIDADGVSNEIPADKSVPPGDVTTEETKKLFQPGIPISMTAGAGIPAPPKPVKQPVRSELTAMVESLRDIKAGNILDYQYAHWKISYVDWIRDIAGGFGLNQLQRVSPEAMVAAQKAASARQQGRHISQDFAATVGGLIAGEKAPVDDKVAAFRNFTSALISSRLLGIKDKYDALVGQYDNAQRDILMDDKMVALSQMIVGNVEGRRGFENDQGMRQRVDRFAEEEARLAKLVKAAKDPAQVAVLDQQRDANADGFRAFMTEVFERAKVNVKDSPLDSGEDVNAYFARPEVKKALDYYKKYVEPHFGAAHLANEGYLTQFLGPSGVYYPLTATDEARGFRGTRRRGEAQAPANPGNNFATGLGEYENSREAFEANVRRSIRENHSAEFLNILEEGGLAVTVGKGEEVPRFMEVGGTRVVASAHDASTPKFIITKAGLKSLPVKRLLIPDAIYNETKHIVFIPERVERGFWHGLTNSITMLNLGGPTDAVFHGMNLMGAAMLRLPYVGPTLAYKVASNIGFPFARTIALFNAVLHADPTQLEGTKGLLGKVIGGRETYHELVRLGIIGGRQGEATYSREYATLTGAEYEGTPWRPRNPIQMKPFAGIRPELPTLRSPVGFGAFIYGPKGLDVRVHLALDAVGKEIATQSAKRAGVPLEQVWTEATRIRFHQMLGNYNFESEGVWMRHLKSSGLAPFATAGIQMNINGLIGMVAGGKLPVAGGDTLKGQVLNRYRAMLIGNVALVNVVQWMILNKAYHDKWPWEMDDTKLGMIRLKPEHRNSTIGKLVFGEDTSKAGFLNTMATTTLLPRGWRISGIKGYLEGKMQKIPADRAEDQSYADVLSGLVHPAVGPPMHLFMKGGLARDLSFEPAFGGGPEFRRSTRGPQKAGIWAGGKERWTAAWANANPILRRFLEAREQEQPAGRFLLDTVLPGLVKGPYKLDTPLQREAFHFYRSQAPPFTPERQAQAKEKQIIRDLFRSGKEDDARARLAVEMEAGRLSKYQARSLATQYATPAYVAELRTAPPSVFFPIYELGTPTEKQQLLPLLNSKISELMNSSLGDAEKNRLAEKAVAMRDAAEAAVPR